MMNAKRTAEQALRQAVMNDANLKKASGDAWDEVAGAIQAWDGIYNEYYLLEQGMAFNSSLFTIARQLTRLAVEKAKPNSDRLREYAEAGLESLEQELYSEAPIYADLETVKLADSLSFCLELLGGDNPLAREILAGKSPRERAADLVAGSKLADVKVRREIAAGGKQAIESSDDALIQLARLVDGPSRAVRKKYEEKVDEPLRQAYGKIAKARFAVDGESTYPDATFTLRLALGQVKGYRDGNDQVPAWTEIGGAFAHSAAHQGKEPFKLPESWHKAKDRLNLTTPFNFISTADIIGGNSGSPVINREGEVVGLIFDGNMHSLVLDFAYSDKQARAVSVHSSSIIEALRNVYDASKLADEITGK